MSEGTLVKLLEVMQEMRAEMHAFTVGQETHGHLLAALNDGQERTLAAIENLTQNVARVVSSLSLKLEERFREVESRLSALESR